MTTDESSAEIHATTRHDDLDLLLLRSLCGDGGDVDDSAKADLGCCSDQTALSRAELHRRRRSCGVDDGVHGRVVGEAVAKICCGGGDDDPDHESDDHDDDAKKMVVPMSIAAESSDASLEIHDDVGSEVADGIDH